MHTFGSIVRHARTNLRMTVAEVSERAGFSQSYLSRIETHGLVPKSPRIIRGLADTLGIPHRVLLYHARYLHSNDMETGVKELRIRNGSPTIIIYKGNRYVMQNGKRRNSL